MSGASASSRGGRSRHLGRFFSYVLGHFPLARAALLSTLVILVLEYASLSLMIPLAAEAGSAASGGGAAVVGAWNRIVESIGLAPRLMTWVWLFLVLLALRSLAGYLHLLLTTYLSKQVHRHLSEAVFSRVLHDEPMAKIYKRSIGFYISLAGDDTFRAGTLTNSALQVLTGIVSAGAGLVLLFLFSPQVFLATVGFLAVSAVLVGLALYRMLQLNAGSVAISREAGTGFLEALNSLRSIRSMAAEDFVQATYREQMRRYTMLLFRVEALRSSIRFVPGLVALLTGIVALGPWSDGLVAASAASVFAATTILIRLFVSLGALMTASSAFLIDARATKDLGMLTAFGHRTTPEGSAAPATAAAAPLSRIDAVRLSHRYEGGGKTLDELDFAFERGNSYAVVGPSGAGKSTLADLILGLIDPVGGEIRVDGIAARPESLRRRVVLVEQQPKIFTASLRDNLLLGTRGDDAEISRVLQIVDMGSFVRGLPAGLDTLIDYQGANLSGGQKQRLSIARALLRQPQVLILDEATSALDTDTRDRVVAAVRAEMKQGILIFITHDHVITKSADLTLLLQPFDGETAGRQAPVRAEALAGS